MCALRVNFGMYDAGDVLTSSDEERWDVYPRLEPVPLGPAHERLEEKG